MTLNCQRCRGAYSVNWMYCIKSSILTGWTLLWDQIFGIIPYLLWYAYCTFLGCCRSYFQRGRGWGSLSVCQPVGCHFGDESLPVPKLRFLTDFDPSLQRGFSFVALAHSGVFAVQTRALLGMRRFVSFGYVLRKLTQAALYFIESGDQVPDVPLG